ncbi:MAG: tRNA (adenosine(37)-N6)-threonylcarbamoyltransferase complex ATPase subunit type 1 TsaE [Clostridia bacterium]|nr:tRNA (adenosine(37)-N6)-threonylcarbamoyltransferase complex ATPase subunit type 1 TsaE [Clostridia bacterium]
MKIHTDSAEETYDFAKQFAQNLQGGDVLCMYGDLGAGKTLFAQGVASGLGIDDYISSPTFTIVNEYEGRIPFYHFDVYRIADSDEMYETGFDDYISGTGVCLIEWAELIDDIIPRPYTKITILRSPDNPASGRDITIETIKE